MQMKKYRRDYIRVQSHWCLVVWACGADCCCNYYYYLKKSQSWQKRVHLPFSMLKSIIFWADRASMTFCKFSSTAFCKIRKSSGRSEALCGRNGTSSPPDVGAEPPPAFAPPPRDPWPAVEPTDVLQLPSKSCIWLSCEVGSGLRAFEPAAWFKTRWQTGETIR